MRKLASIRIVSDLQPIPNADLIEKARVDGWWCVVKKGEFQIGDPCVYFEVDSFLPKTEAFSFLKEPKKVILEGIPCEGYRLKTIRLRGQVAQGLALPLKAFPEVTGLDVGTEVTKLLGVKKYEEQLPACVAGESRGGFPSQVRKTDEERIQNLLDQFSRFRNKRFIKTEKMDGTSATFCKIDMDFQACSRNLSKKDVEISPFWQIARKHDLITKLPNNFAVQGEIILGTKNRYGVIGPQFYVFYMYDIESGMYLTYEGERVLTEEWGLNHVPILDDNFIFDDSVTLESLLQASDELQSVVNPKVAAEGIVYSEYNNPNRLSFKVVSNRFLLKDER